MEWGQSGKELFLTALFQYKGLWIFFRVYVKFIEKAIFYYEKHAI